MNPIAITGIILLVIAILYFLRSRQASDTTESEGMSAVSDTPVIKSAAANKEDSVSNEQQCEGGVCSVRPSKKKVKTD